ncbi:kinase-like protein [Aulographum hederae CBS 113979]|uniref:ethanolamine kinase n=1 Tax=Aulographum hederae CBS 113979 TaxID=1176131 RepID=A0A6G1GV28_9PEZI|nr:kinase-like protein [Aulographum hederae CBS 113979]
MAGPSDKPPSIRHISLAYNKSESNDSAIRLVIALLPEWEQSRDTIQLVHFTDGITNTLLKIVNKRPELSDHEVDKDAVLLRAYGEGTDVLIDRNREEASHSLLASRGLAPALLARFNNGLLYRYIEGEVCTPADLRRPEIFQAVARRLAEWHAKLPISAISSTEGDPFRERANGATNGAESLTPGKPVPNVWTVTEKWIAALPATTSAQKSRRDTLQRELAWATKKLGNVPGINHQPFVFAHCDLLSGNVIIQPKKSIATKEPSTTVSFIDYEYATPAPAAFDLANHFAEWGGFDCDFSVLPTKSQRRDFLRTYLLSYNSHLSPSKQLDVEQALEQLSNEVDAFRGIPGLYWGTWALIQATISQIEFDYASYAEIRLGEYWAWKAEAEGTRPASDEMPLRERRWAQVE